MFKCLGKFKSSLKSTQLPWIYNSSYDQSTYAFTYTKMNFQATFGTSALEIILLLTAEV